MRSFVTRVFGREPGRFVADGRFVGAEKRAAVES
jgi:hypothetical protein